MLKGDCEFCHFKTDVSYYGGGSRPGYLCKVCVNTYAGEAFMHPSLHKEQTAVLATICWGINYLKGAIDCQK